MNSTRERVHTLASADVTDFIWAVERQQIAKQSHTRTPAKGMNDMSAVITTTPLAGRVAIVTGASSGIGEATAFRLATLGAKVAVAARRSDKLDALAARITAAAGTALPLPLDVTDRSAVTAAAEQVADELGPVDLVFNNAGVQRISPNRRRQVRRLAAADRPQHHRRDERHRCVRPTAHRLGRAGQTRRPHHHLLDRGHPRTGEALGVLRDRGLHQPVDWAAACRTRPKDVARLHDRAGIGGYRAAGSCQRPRRYPVDG